MPFALASEYWLLSIMVFVSVKKPAVCASATVIAFADPTPEDLKTQNLFKPIIVTPQYAIYDMTKPTAQGIIDQEKN